MRKITWIIDYFEHKKGTVSQVNEKLADAYVRLKYAKYVAKPKAED